MSPTLESEICIRLEVFSARMHEVVDADDQREMNFAIVEIRNCVVGLVEGMDAVNHEDAHGYSAKENIAYVVDVLRTSRETAWSPESLEVLENVKASVDELYRGLELSRAKTSGKAESFEDAGVSGLRLIGETEPDEEDAGGDTPWPPASEDLV